jgi:flagellar motor switch protein FliG
MPATVDHLALSGLEKVAILLIAMGEERAGHVLKQLKPAEVEKVAGEISRQGQVDARTRLQVVQEFLQMLDMGGAVTEGGMEYARAALEKALGEGRASMILSQVGRPEREGFSVLAAADPGKLVTLLTREHPQTIALILTQVHAEKSAAILARLPEKLRPEVVARIAAMDRVTVEVLDDVKNVIVHDFGEMIGDSVQVETGGGAESAAAILNFMDKKLGSETLDTLAEVDPDLVTEIRNKMFVFEDIRLLDDRSVQRLLKEVDAKSLALAIKVSSDEIKELVFRNMSSRAGELLKEELELMGPVRLSVVEEGQRAIVDIVRRLEDEGEIVVSGRGGNEDALV